MSFIRWLRNFRSAITRARMARKHRRRSAAGGLRAAMHRPQLEVLEDRCLPSFLAPVSYAVGSNPQAVITANFNNDAVLDLAVVNNELITKTFQTSATTSDVYQLMLSLRYSFN